MLVAGLTHDLLAALLPGRCPGCGVRAEPVCPGCATSLHPAPPAPPPVGVEQWWAAFAYDGVARELVARVKYRNARAALPFLADAMTAAIGAAATRVQTVTWAPTTVARRRDRGFDHAALLARAVGARLRVPVRPLLRRERGAAQTGQPSAVRRVGPRMAARGPVAGCRILVVDDVATTGATLAAAATALRWAGAATVLAAVAARTPPPGG